MQLIEEQTTLLFSRLCRQQSPYCGRSDDDDTDGDEDGDDEEKERAAEEEGKDDEGSSLVSRELGLRARVDRLLAAPAARDDVEMTPASAPAHRRRVFLAVAAKWLEVSG